jgi:hypothetical protein
MNVRFGPNKRPIDIINPYVTLDEWKQMRHGNFTVTPNTIASHFFTTSAGGVLGYKLTSWAIGRGLPIGPLEPWKVLKNAHFYRTASMPLRYARYAGIGAIAAPALALTALGVGTVLFSDYMSQHDPYSRPTHLTPEYFDMRRQAGY